MSKIGKKPIEIPEEVIVKLEKGEIIVSGPKGNLCQKIPSEIAVNLEGDRLVVIAKDKSEFANTLQGTFRSLISNMVKGVKDGWEKTLEISGTGFRALLEGRNLVLYLGFSHPVKITPPEGISFSVSERKIQIFGTDKALVGKIAAEIRRIKPPDAYKGKGIRYEGEIIKLKPGKQAKIGGAGGGTK
jgi:large subunit ribosomal protein L6